MEPLLKGSISNNAKEKYKNILAKEMKKYQMVDINGNVYATGDIDNIYYDENDILTIDFLIPYETDYNVANDSFRILNENDDILTIVKTKNITYEKGCGGVQTLKFPVSEKAGNIVFKKHNHISRNELEKIYKPNIDNLRAKEFSNLEDETNKIKDDINVLIDKKRIEFENHLKNIDDKLVEHKKLLDDEVKKCSDELNVSLDDENVNDIIKKCVKPEVKGFDFVETTNPLVTTNGKLGDTWFNKDTLEIFKCTDETTDKNQWEGSKGTNIGSTLDTLDIFKDNSCVALYRFTDNTDDLGGTNNGVATNITYVDGGVLGKLAKFNGTSSKIALPDSVFSPTFAISTFIEGTDMYVIANNYFASGAFGWVFAKIINGGLTVIISNNSSSASITIPSFAAIGERVHLVISVSSTEVSVYRDKVLMDTKTKSFTPTNNGTIYIGAWSYSKIGRNFYKQGSVGQFRIFNRGVTQLEVDELYSEGQ